MRVDYQLMHRTSVAEKSAWFITLLFFLQISVFHPLIRDVPAAYHKVVIPAYFIVVMTAYILFFYHARFRSVSLRLLSSYQLLLVFMLVMIIVGAFLYHHDMWLQAHLIGGNDESNALIISARNLIHGLPPYQQLTNAHNPVSPGPGWIILLMPFTLTGLYILIMPFFIALLVLTFTKLFNIRYGFLFLILLSSSLTFWELLGDGSDIVALGCAYTLLVILVYHYWGRNIWLNIAIIVLTGLLATARINFIYIGPLLGFFLFFRSRLVGILFGVATLAITMSTHLIFYLWDSHYYYGPFIVLFEAKSALPLALLIPALVICFAVGIFVLMSEHKRLSDWLRSLWLITVAPLFFVSVGGLFALHLDFNRWVQANYIFYTMPMLISWFLTSIAQQEKKVRALQDNSV